jgi:hypothetical protein
MRLDPDYSVIMFLFITNFEKRQAMFIKSKKIVLPRTVSPHRKLGFEKELNTRRAFEKADNFLRVTRR